MIALYFSFLLLLSRSISSKSSYNNEFSISVNFSSSNIEFISLQVNNHNLRNLFNIPEKIKNNTQLLICFFEYIYDSSNSELIERIKNNSDFLNEVNNTNFDNITLEDIIDKLIKIMKYDDVYIFLKNFMLKYHNNFNLSSMINDKNYKEIVDVIQNNEYVISFLFDVFHNLNNITEILDILFEAIPKPLFSESMIFIIKSISKDSKVLDTIGSKIESFLNEELPIMKNFINIVKNDPELLTDLLDVLSSGDNQKLQEKANYLKEINHNFKKNMTALKDAIVGLINITNEDLRDLMFSYILKLSKNVKTIDFYVDMIFGYLVDILEDYVQNNVLKDYNLTSGCINLLKYSFIGKDIDSQDKNLKIAKYFLYKSFMHSSRNRNDLLSYHNCLFKDEGILEGIIPNSNDEIKSLKANMSYIVSLVDQTEQNFKELKKNILLEKYYYLFTFCFAGGKQRKHTYANNTDQIYYCNNEDYEKITKIILSSFTIMDGTEIKSFHMPIDYSGKSNITKLIPVGILSIPFLIYIIILVSRNIVKKEKNISIINMPLKGEAIKNIIDDNDNVDKNDGFKEVKEANNLNSNKSLLSRFCESLNEYFNLKENFDELFNFKSNNTIINNTEGIYYIKGLMGIEITLSILGYTFLVFVNSPIKYFGIYHFYIFIAHLLYILPFNGLRYAPRIVFSCSGYIFTYKYLSFIEKQTNYYYIKFILLQAYKYIYFILIILFGRYSFYHLLIPFAKGPAWQIFKKIILEKPESSFLLNLLTIKSLFISKDKKKEIGNLFDYFWMPINEIFFFIVGTSLISVGYKFKLRIDKIILISIILLYFLKIIFYFWQREEIYTTLYYYLFDYGKLMINPLFNINYYLIGMYFGLMNYTIQTGITDLNNENDLKLLKYTGSFDKDEDENLKENNYSKLLSQYNNSIEDEIYDKEKNDIRSVRANTISKKYKILNDKSLNIKPRKRSKKVKENKYIKNRIINPNTNEINKELYEMPFLISAVNIVKWHKNPDNNCYLIIPLIVLTLIIILFIFAHYILLFFDRKGEPKTKEEVEEKYSLNNIITSKILNILYLLDIEIVVFYIQWIFFVLYIKGKFSINEFLNLSFWNILIKSYFSLLISISLIILYLFYESDSKISFNLNSLYLYFFIGLVLILGIMILSYIAIELPLKKISKTIFKEKTSFNADKNYNIMDLYKDGNNDDFDSLNNNEEINNRQSI